MNLGRYFSERDVRFINSVNYELLEDIIQTFVIVYKINPSLTTDNIYGESRPETGKIYYPGVKLVCLIEHPDTSTEDDDRGPDRKKEMIFRFHETLCKEINLYTEVGDIIYYDYQYFEINNVSQEQHLGGISDKSFSIICNAFLTKYSKLNTENRPLK